MDPLPSRFPRTSSSTSNQSDSPLPRTSSSYQNTSQSLSSILNNPHLNKSDSSVNPLSWWWSPSSSITPPEFLPPLTIQNSIPNISKSEFDIYLSKISESYSRFEDIQNHSKNNEGILDLSIGQGEALVACLREVPSLYFKEDFALQEGATFRAACPFSSPLENVALQEKLSYYLDTVEVHLVKEISLRSNSFFQAQGQLQDLNGEVFEACGRIRELKEMIRILDGDLVDSARSIQDLNSTRSNLIALQHKLSLILYVNQAMSALKLVKSYCYF